MTMMKHAVEIVGKFGEKVFVIDATSDRAVTYNEFHRMACSFAAELARRGIRRGQRMAVMSPNCVELAALYFGCMYLGAAIVPLNPNLNRPELEFILSNCKPNLVVGSPSCSTKLRTAHPSAATFVPATECALATDGDVMCPDPSGSVGMPQEASDTDLIAIMYTSGTTRKPKGLAHRVGSMVRNAQAFARMNGINADTRFYNTLSMAYMGGFYNLTVLPFLCGGSVIIDRVFDARSSLTFWDTAIRHGCNALWFAPTVMSVLMKMDRGQRGEQFCRNSVRCVFVGFAPLPVQLKEQFEHRYGVSLIENYGLSETLFLTARAGHQTSGTGYVGESVPGIQIRVVDENGRDLPPAREGEIEVLTPDLMEGYLDENGSVVRADETAWFATGDCGYTTSHDSLFITGRKKDLIIRGGVNISPAAIEEVLRQHRGVVDVSVVSIPHELYGEDIAAVLKLEPDIELDTIRDSLAAHAKHLLAEHQQPARYMSIDEFPRTSTGKVQKVRLRELVMTKLQLNGILSSEASTAKAASQA